MRLAVDSTFSDQGATENARKAAVLVHKFGLAYRPLRSTE
jgi:hypothetical protein